MLKNFPRTIYRLKQLQELILTACVFYGGISEEIGGLSQLVTLNLQSNHFNGSLPSSIWNLTSLAILDVSDNELTGSLPTSIRPPSSLTNFSIGTNYLTGTFEESIWSNLTELMRFSIGKNAFTGPFPRWMMLSWNKLKGLDLSWNNFTGTLPTEDHYYLGWANALYLLDLEGNEFNGTVPRGLSMLSNLALLGLADNMFSGTLPEFIGNMTQLLIVSLNNNLFMGRFPEAYSSLSSLRALHIYDNFLTNSLPSSLGNMTSLKSLRVFDNLFSGTLPHSLGDLLSLNILLAHRNILTGTIPASMISCEMMGELKLSYNFFTGYIPSALDKMSNLYSLEVQVNSLSGGWHELDSEFSFLLNLNASVNFFNGNLSFANYLLSVYSIDFSHNLLTGHIDPIGDMHDPYSKLYSCGSSTTDISLIVWGALVTFITAITLLLIWQQQKHFDPTSSSSTSLRWSGYFARLTIELNHFFNRLLRWYMFYKKKSEISQRNGLIWKESIRNIGHLFEAVREDDEQLCGDAKFKTQPNAACSSEMEREAGRAHEESTQPSRVIGWNRFNLQGCYRLMVMVLITLFNIIVVVAVNGAYVYSSLNSDRWQVFLSSMALSVFKLWWGNVIQWAIIQFLQMYSPYSANQLERGAADNQSSSSQGSGEGPAVGREEPADVVNQLHLLQRKAGGVDVKREDEDDPVDERKSRSDQDNPTGSDDRVFYAASSREEDDSTKGDTKSADDNDVYFSISLPLLSVAERCSRSFNSGLVESLETMREHGHHGDAARRKLMQTVCQECQHLLEALLLAVRPVFAIAIAFCSFFLLDAEGDDHGAEKGAYFVMALWVFALLCYVGLFHGDWCLEFIQSAPSLLISTLRKNRKKRDEESSVELPPSVPSTSVQEVEEERE
eukprot:gene4157-4566_t